MNEEASRPEGLGPTSLGINANFAAALSYLLGFVTGFLFLLLETQNKFVRFHAIQSILTWVAFLVVYLILGFVPVLDKLLLVAGLVLWLTLIVKAYHGERFRLPFIGDTAEKNC